MLKPVQIRFLLLFLYMPLCLFSQENFRFRHWGNQEGLKFGFVDDVVKDQQGFVWIATPSGLWRFDGEEERLYNQSSGGPHSLSENWTIRLFQDPRGRIWAGHMNGGISLYDQQIDGFHTFRYFLKNEGKKQAITRIYNFFYDGKKIIAVGQSGACYFDENQGSFKEYAPWNNEKNTPGIPFSLKFVDSTGIHFLQSSGELFLFDSRKNDLKHLFQVRSFVNHVYRQKEEIFWIGTWSDGVFKLNIKTGEYRQYRHDPGNESSIASNNISHISIDKSGNLWIGNMNRGPNILSDDSEIFLKFRPYEDAPNSYRGTVVKHIFTDEEGGVWMAAGPEGVNYYNPSFPSYKVYPLQGADRPGIRGEVSGIRKILEDPEGKVWIFHTDGVDRLDPATGDILQIKNGSSPNAYYGGYPETVFLHAEDEIWVTGTPSGFSRIDFHTGRVRSTKDFFKKNHALNGYAKEVSGKTWVTTYNGIYQYDESADTLIPLDDKFLSTLDAREIESDKEGFLWVGSWDKGVTRIDPLTLDYKLYQHDPEDSKSIGENYVSEILVDKQGTIYAVADWSINKYQPETDNFQRIYINQLVANADMTDILLADDDRLWIGTSSGLIKLDAASGEYRLFNRKDGLPGDNIQCLGYSLSSGKIYVGTDKDFFVVDPEKLSSSRTEFPVRFISFLYRNKQGRHFIHDILSRTSVHLDYNDDYIEMKFSCSNFDFDGNLNFQYQIEGMTDSWIDLGDRRLITLTDPAPGEYEVRVRTLNADGTPSQNQAKLLIRIATPWWQTPVAYFTYLLMLLTAGFTYVQFRTLSLKKEQIVLEHKVQERTKEIKAQKEVIEKEKERSENLLLNILPSQVADELKQKGFAEARLYENVTVLFTDFKNFTTRSEQLKPRELVSELHNCFKAFDEITSKYNVEKIKTVGDGYIAVAGLPVANENHALDIVRVAIEIRDFMKQRKKELKDATFEVRIGVNSGQVVAGIVGVKKFAFDIWGDTVNIAARMEESCEVGNINISATTYQLVKHEFQCEYRGAIPAKNKGDIDMYYIERP